MDPNDRLGCYRASRTPEVTQRLRAYAAKVAASAHAAKLPQQPLLTEGLNPELVLIPGWPLWHITKRLEVFRNINRTDEDRWHLYLTPQGELMFSHLFIKRLSPWVGTETPIDPRVATDDDIAQLDQNWRPFRSNSSRSVISGYGYGPGQVGDVMNPTSDPSVDKWGLKTSLALRHLYQQAVPAL